MMNIHGALARKRQELQENGEKGFTLIELLVVVLIIGILTAIAVPIFLGQQNEAKDAAAKSDLGVAKVAYVSYQTANNGTAPTTTAHLTSYGYVQSAGVSAVTITTAADGTFCLQNTSATSATSHFGITGSTGAAKGTCSGGSFTAAS